MKSRLINTEMKMISVYPAPDKHRQQIVSWLRQTLDHNLTVAVLLDFAINMKLRSN